LLASYGWTRNIFNERIGLFNFNKDDLGPTSFTYGTLTRRDLLLERGITNTAGWRFLLIGHFNIRNNFRGGLVLLLIERNF